MITSSNAVAIREKYNTGNCTKSSLAREFCCAPTTITNVLNRTEDKDVYVRSSNPDNLLIMPYRKLIKEWLEKADLKIENVLQKLLALGAILSRSTVGRAVKAIKYELDLAAIRYETTPGQQGQVDWGEFPGYKAVVDGVEKPIYALFIVLGYSRAKYVEFTTEMTCETMIRCIENGLRFFGGTPRELLFDNMPQVVNRCLRDDNSHSLERELVPEFTSFADYYGFDIVLTRVRRPQEKGKVESFVKFFKDGFIPLLEKKTGHTIEDLNSRARKWCDKVNSEVHRTTNEKPCDRLPHEPLTSLPDIPYYDFDTITVHRDGSVYFRGSVYSVDSKYAGETGTILLKGNTIFAVINNELVILGKRKLPVYIRKRYSRTKESVKKQSRKNKVQSSAFSRFIKSVSTPFKFTRSFFDAHFRRANSCLSFHIPLS